MKPLMGQEYGASPKETTEILTNGKKGVIQVQISPVRVNGPMGIRTPVSGSEGRKDIQTTS